MPENDGGSMPDGINVTMTPSVTWPLSLENEPDHGRVTSEIARGLKTYLERARETGLERS
jgi:hypothetical protein